MDFSNSKFLYGEDGKTKTHIQTDLGSSKFVVFSINNNNNIYQQYVEWVAEGNSEAADNTLTWDDIRSTRDGILHSTDWTMTTGASVDQAQWAAYRQNLRDLPQTYKDKTPGDVVWPTQPSTAGPNT